MVPTIGHEDAAIALSDTCSMANVSARDARSACEHHRIYSGRRDRSAGIA
jgi:hypothetical protein